MVRDSWRRRDSSISRRRQRACHGCFMARDVLRGALLTVEFTPICKRGNTETVTKEKVWQAITLKYNNNYYYTVVSQECTDGYTELVITCKRTVSFCGYYKRMRLTTGVYGTALQLGIIYC